MATIQDPCNDIKVRAIPCTLFNLPLNFKITIKLYNKTINGILWKFIPEPVGIFLC